MCFVQDFREFVSDCITKRGRCLVVFDQLGYHHTTMYLDKVSSADIVIRDDGCLWKCHNYLCRQLLYDGVHIRSWTLPLHRKKWVCLMDSEIVCDALRAHWNYLCKIYQYASCFYEVRSIFENLYFSKVSSFRSFCMHFLSLCAWSLGLHVMHVSISEILASLPIDNCFWWASCLSYERHIKLWKYAFVRLFQELVWDTMFWQIRILNLKVPHDWLYQQILRGRNIIEEVLILLNKDIDVVMHDIAQGTYHQCHSIWRPFVPHLWLLDFFFNYGFSWCGVRSSGFLPISITNIY